MFRDAVLSNIGFLDHVHIVIQDIFHSSVTELIAR